MSKIIKKRDADKVDSFFSQARFMEARTDDKQRRKLLDEAKAHAASEAESILNEAKKQAAVEQQNAYQEGLRQGVEKLAPLEGTLTSILEELRVYRDTYVADLEPQLVDLVVRICGKILKNKMADDRELILRTVQDAFNQITDKEYIKIRLNNEDYELMDSHRKDFCAKFHQIKDFQIVVDETIDRGGCILETNEGSVDATIRTQIDRVFNALTCESAIAGIHVR